MGKPLTPYDRVLHALEKAEMSKTDISKVTNIPYGPLGYILTLLITEKRVEKVGLRYKLKEKPRVKRTP